MDAMAWRNSRCRRQDDAVFKAKTRLVKRPVGVEDLVPGAVFAELVGGGFGQIHRAVLPGAQSLG